MMQVLHIISGLGDGGAEAVLYRLCKFDKDNNHTVISLTGKQKYGEMLEAIGIHVYNLDIIRNKGKIFRLIELYKIIKKLKPDVVQTWMIHADFIGGLLARFAGIKHIFWGVHHTKLEGGRFISLIGRINAFLSYFIPKKIIYCAEKSKEMQELIGFSKAKGIVIHNGYNLHEFAPDKKLRSSFRNELNFSEDSILIGHVGRYDPLKDLNSLIKSFSILKNDGIDFHAVIVGANLDKENQELLKLINESHLACNINLLGMRQDIPTVMNGIDLFILSSTTEAFPNVLNEAMACGIPCISTDAGDCSYIVGKTGWVVPIKDYHAIAKAIINAIDEKSFNESKWLARKQVCRQRVLKKFNIEKMVNSYIKLWMNYS